LQKEKREKHFEEHGVYHHMQLPNNVETVQNTNMGKYGYRNVLQVPEIKARSMNTNFDKRGTTEYFASEEFKLMNKQRTLEETGWEYKMQDPSFQTYLEDCRTNKLGVPFIRQDENKNKEMMISQRSKKWGMLSDALQQRGINPKYTIDNYIDLDYVDREYHCTYCGNDFVSDKYLHDVTCPCKKSRSKFEIEIVNWLNSIAITNIEANKRYCKENSGIYNMKSMCIYLITMLV